MSYNMISYLANQESDTLLSLVDGVFIYQKLLLQLSLFYRKWSCKNSFKDHSERFLFHFNTKHSNDLVSIKTSGLVSTFLHE